MLRDAMALEALGRAKSCPFLITNYFFMLLHMKTIRDREHDEETRHSPFLSLPSTATSPRDE